MCGARPAYDIHKYVETTGVIGQLEALLADGCDDHELMSEPKPPAFFSFFGSGRISERGDGGRRGPIRRLVGRPHLVETSPMALLRIRRGLTTFNDRGRPNRF